MMRQVHLVVGARPNVMKIGPLFHALAAAPWAAPRIIHTGQHSSPEMSDVFYRDLGLPRADFHLGAIGTTHAEQTAAVMVAYERLLMREPPDWVVVAGDVNSTLAACLAAKKLGVPVAHLEAGLRSRDRSMPEELNRIVVDALCDLLWTPSPDGDENLAAEGIPASRVELVGNVMIDAYRMLRPAIERAAVPASLGVRPPYAASVQQAYREFYLRPKIVWKWLQNMAHIPLGRSLRYIKAGVSYLLVSPVDASLQRLFAHFSLMRFARKAVSYRGRGYRW